MSNYVIHVSSVSLWCSILSSCYMKFAVYFPLAILRLQYIYICIHTHTHTHLGMLTRYVSLFVSLAHSPTVTTSDCTWYTRSSGLRQLRWAVDKRAGGTVYYHNCHIKNHS